MVFYGIFGLQLMSFAQQSKNMVLASRYDDDSLAEISGIAYNDVWGYAYEDGREIAVIGTLDSVLFFEVTNPDSIKRVFSFSGGTRTIWREFKTYQHYLYAITDAESEGLTVFDLGTSPDSISFKQRDFSVFLKAHMLFVDTSTSHLYLAGSQDSTGPVDLIMMDLLSNPAKPILIKKIDLPGNYVHDLFVRNDTAFCSHGYNGFYIYRILPNGNFTELSSINSYTQQGYNHSSWLHENGQYLIWADETHNTSLKMVDVKNRTQPKIVQLFRSAHEAPVDTASIAHNPYFHGNYAYVSYYHDGVVVFNCEDPLRPSIVAYYDTEPGNTDYSQGYAGAWGVYPFLPSGTILGSDIRNGLFVMYLDFLLDLCEIKLHGTLSSGEFVLEWEIPQSICYDQAVLQKAQDDGIFKDFQLLKFDETSLRDPLNSFSNSYYRIRYTVDSTDHFSNIVHFKNSQETCGSFDVNKRALVSDCEQTFVSQMALYRPDGRVLINSANVRLPYDLPQEWCGFFYMLLKWPDGRLEKIKIFLP